MLNRIRRIGFMLIAGLVVIAYAGIGIIFLQQQPNQDRVVEQAGKLLAIATRPLPSITQLRADYDGVNRSLTPMAIPDVLDIIVGVVKKSGINVDPNAGKLSIPTAEKTVAVRIGTGKYEELLFKSVRVQGTYAQVMAFVAEIDSGKVLKTMTLKRVEIEDVKLPYKGEEEIRRREFRAVAAAVTAMMADNKLASIPNPRNYASGSATQDMTLFPDFTSTWADVNGGKIGDTDGKPYAPGDGEGYILYHHDKKTDGGKLELMNYVSFATTKYFYTAEQDGKVRQFNGADPVTATEYRDSNEHEIETLATVNIALYSRPTEAPKPK